MVKNLSIMNRPDVRVVQNQQVDTSTREVSGWEAEQLLRKYGHDQHFSTRQEPISEPIVQQPALSFEEMIRQQEEKERMEQNRRQQQLNAPKPITFSSQNGYDTEVKYGSDDDSGFGFKIEITTDMNLPKY